MYPKAPDYDYEQGQPLRQQPMQQAPATVMVTAQEPYSSTPICCSLFALFCCPYGCLCAILGLVYGMCGYTDHRVNDMGLYRTRIGKAKCCAIAAILLGILIPAAVVALCYFALGASVSSLFSRFQQQNSYEFSMNSNN